MPFHWSKQFRSIQQSSAPETVIEVEISVSIPIEPEVVIPEILEDLIVPDTAEDLLLGETVAEEEEEEETE